MEQLAYGVLREGLTNVMKHAPAADVRVRVVIESGTLENRAVRRARRDARERGGHWLGPRPLPAA
jgi:hypothetical protein